VADVIHQGCGQVAFHYDGIPHVGDVMDHRKATLLDGTKPKAQQEVRCGACGQGFMPRVQDVREVQERKGSVSPS